jgi:pimeloyl-ACP methyl ester carboxylesterase
VNSDRLAQFVPLADGRRLAYASYGTVTGFPVFYFTGGNSSRLEGQWFEQALHGRDIHLIVPDRPGFGQSSFQPQRRLSDWPDDVIALADAIGIDQFSVFGLSGGGPYVLALASIWPDRLRQVAVVSGTAPPEMPDKFKGMWPPVRLIFGSARRWPRLNRFLLRQMGAFYSDEAQMAAQMRRALPAPDVELIDRRPEIIQIFAETTREAHRHGIAADAQEWQLYVRPWDFDMAAIQHRVRLWYGLYDKQVPIGMGRYLARVLPSAALSEVADGGHFSTINNHIDAILDGLIRIGEP